MVKNATNARGVPWGLSSLFVVLAWVVGCGNSPVVGGGDATTKDIAEASDLLTRSAQCRGNRGEESTNSFQIVGISQGVYALEFRCEPRPARCPGKDLERR